MLLCEVYYFTVRFRILSLLYHCAFRSPLHWLIVSEGREKDGEFYYAAKPFVLGGRELVHVLAQCMRALTKR